MRELERVVSDLPEDIESFFVQVSLQAFWRSDSDSNTLLLVWLAASLKVAEVWKPRTKDATFFHSSSWAKDEVELPHQVVQR